MNELLAFAAHNTVAAAVLALFVFVLTRQPAQSAVSAHTLDSRTDPPGGASGHACRVVGARSLYMERPTRADSGESAAIRSTAGGVPLRDRFRSECTSVARQHRKR